MRKCVLIGLIVAALGCGFFGGYVVGGASEAARQESEAVDALGSHSILPTTEVTWTLHFDACGHDAVLHDGTAVMGMTAKQIAAAFPNVTVLLLDSSRAVLIGEMDGCCPEHYLLCATDDGRLTVKRFSPALMGYEECMELAMSAWESDEEARSELEDGIAFDTLAEIDMYIEAMET